jgi:hypothetical protein
MDVRGRESPDTNLTKGTIVLSLPSERILPIASLAVLATGTAMLLHPSMPAVGAAVLTGFDRTARQWIEFGAHVAVFFAMTALVLAITQGGGSSTATAILLSIAWAVASEYAQAWVPQRSVDMRDAACNLAGVAAAVWLMRKRPHQKTIAASSSSPIAGV